MPPIGSETNKHEKVFFFCWQKSEKKKNVGCVRTSGNLSSNSWNLAGCCGKLCSTKLFRHIIYRSWIASNSFEPPRPWFNIVITLRQTYSSILNLTRRNINVTCVIFSTIKPTSCLNWSIVMGRPIIEVKHVCNVTRLFETCRQTSSTKKKNYINFHRRCHRHRCLGLLGKHKLLLVWNPLPVRPCSCSIVYELRVSPDMQKLLKQEVRATCVWEVACELRPVIPNKKEVFSSTVLICKL